MVLNPPSETLSSVPHNNNKISMRNNEINAASVPGRITNMPLTLNVGCVAPSCVAPSKLCRPNIEVVSPQHRSCVVPTSKLCGSVRARFPYNTYIYYACSFLFYKTIAGTMELVWDLFAVNNFKIETVLHWTNLSVMYYIKRSFSRGMENQWTLQNAAKRFENCIVSS